jgi:hypothetical protein
MISNNLLIYFFNEFSVYQIIIEYFLCILFLMIIHYANAVQRMTHPKQADSSDQWMQTADGRLLLSGDAN